VTAGKQRRHGAAAHAVVPTRTQAKLRERVKELTCLYEIARLVASPGKTLGEVLQRIAELLPPAWLHADIASAGIVLDGRLFSTPGFERTCLRQSADILVKGRKRGVVEAAYAEERPPLDEGPFLKEERSLIDAVAREISVVVEQKTLEQDQEETQEQLRRADRLATLGLLSASIAHEMNEPLEGILGFAQLIRKAPGLPESAERDARKIVEASLHARDIVRKMRLVSRQSPAQKSSVNVNRLVEEGLSLLENKCKRSGIDIVKLLAPDLPDITADPTQLRQVLVNLVVNADQAMPRGGKITITTRQDDHTISLIVEDSGTGIDSKVLDRIFDPFFTLKNANEGTGLGLAIVHRIVSSHGGKINVDSQPGKGSRFEVILPLGPNPGSEEKGRNANV